MRSQLPSTEQDALKRILRHNGVINSQHPQLLDQLCALIEWVHACEKARASFTSGKEPMPLISLLGNMGIYGKDYIDKVET